jgi:capsular exopolysaccharide synthesis family protein
MKNNLQNNPADKPASGDENLLLKEILEQYLAHWKWFVLSLFLFIGLAFVYLRYTIPLYKASMTVMIKDDRKGGDMVNELTAFSDLSSLTNSKRNVDSEMEILKSRTLIEQTVMNMMLNVSYINLGRIRSEDLYKNKDIDVIFSNIDNSFFRQGWHFIIQPETDSSFLLLQGEGKSKTFRYGELIANQFCNFKVIKNYNHFFKEITGPIKIKVQVRPVDEVVESYRARLGVSILNKNTSAVELTLTDPVKNRSLDFLNTLFRIYLQNEKDEKNLISENTSRFIKERLDLMNSSLEGVEKESEVYKKLNSVTDIKSEADIYLENSSIFQKNVMDTEIQLKVVQSLIEFVRGNNQYNLMPNNILNADGSYNDQVAMYNQLILERNKLLLNAKPGNPMIIAMDAKIEVMNKNMLSSLNTIKNSLQIKKRDLERQEAMMKGKISQIPTQEREVRVLARQQQIKEQLYLYLLQKGEEIAISLAISAPNAKLIDQAAAMKVPISPNRSVIWLGAFLLGLVVPFLSIYVNDLLDTKVKDRKDLESRFRIPFLGDVPRSLSKGERLTPGSRSSLAEALRIIRTNLEFMVSKVPKGRAKTIFVTSTLPKEGKTFVSINISKTIAFTGKRVLLMGMDLRNPKLHKYFDLPSREGITDYLIAQNGRIDSFMVKLEGFENLYVLPSGSIPPNPAELLLTDKLEALFDDLKSRFDYIIVDTVPSSIVTDTFLLSKFSDAFVYVVRSHFLDKRKLYFLENYYEGGKLPNLGMVLNYTKNNLSYGYGQDIEKKSIFQRLRY